MRWLPLVRIFGATFVGVAGYRRDHGTQLQSVDGQSSTEDGWTVWPENYALADGDCQNIGTDLTSDMSGCKSSCILKAHCSGFNYRYRAKKGCVYRKCSGENILRQPFDAANGSARPRVDGWQLFHRTLAAKPLLQEKAHIQEGAFLSATTKFQSDRTVGILVLADEPFRKLYRTHIFSLKCYADRHNYDLHVFPMHHDQPRRCRGFRNVFFKKHCIVAEFLRAQREDYRALVVDADVHAVALDRSLEKWLKRADDLQFYVRDDAKEIAAGGYLAKNSVFTRNVLMNWASYEGRQPRGFSSSDNGALHVVLLQATGVIGGNVCADMYSHLINDVTNLDPYYEFISCSRDKLGTLRQWHANMDGSTGLVTIWPAQHFVQADGVNMLSTASPDVGPVFHHGIKNESFMLCNYFENLANCEMSPTTMLRRAEFLEIQTVKRDEHCTQCTPQCLKHINCEPLGPDDEDAKARQVRASLPFKLPQVADGTVDFLSAIKLEDHPKVWNWRRDRVDLKKFVSDKTVFPAGIEDLKCNGPPIPDALLTS